MPKFQRIGDHGQDKYMKYQNEKSNYTLSNNTLQMITPVKNIKKHFKAKCIFPECKLTSLFYLNKKMFALTKIVQTHVCIITEYVMCKYIFFPNIKKQEQKKNKQFSKVWFK